MRRAAAKCLESVIATRHELLGEMYQNVSPALIARFKGIVSIMFIIMINYVNGRGVWFPVVIISAIINPFTITHQSF